MNKQSHISRMMTMKKHETLFIILAYLAIIIIWSTTPLAIKWSSEGVGFISGIFFNLFKEILFFVGCI